MSKIMNNLLPSVLAQGVPAKQRLWDIAGEAQYSTNAGSAQPIIVNIIIYALGFLGVYFLILIIISGVQWMTAGGNEEKIQHARSRMKNAIIGFAIVMTAYSLTYLVTQMFVQSAAF